MQLSHSPPIQKTNDEQIELAVTSDCYSRFLEMSQATFIQVCRCHLAARAGQVIGPGVRKQAGVLIYWLPVKTVFVNGGTK